MKFSSVRRKKRKGFHGKRPQELTDSSRPSHAADDDEQTAGPSNDDRFSNTEIEGPTAESNMNKSIEKLANTSFNDIEESFGIITRSKSIDLLGESGGKEHEAKGLKILDTDLLASTLSSAFSCKNCKTRESSVKILVNDEKREGLAECLTIVCDVCGFRTPLPVSKRIESNGAKGSKPLEVNLRSVVSSYPWGRAGLESFCGMMGFPKPLSSRAYNEQLKKVDAAAVNIANKIMLDAAERLRHKVEIEDPSKVNVMSDGTTVVDVAVTVDGTWQKRGHSSRIGVVFIISVITGEVLDYVIKSLSCHECRSHANDKKDTETYKKWQQEHTEYCHINHKGSSGEMEVAGAVEMFSRSVETRGLRYMEFVGDGDSSSFGKVKDALEKKYGEDYSIIKEECVGHVKKTRDSTESI